MVRPGVIVIVNGFDAEPPTLSVTVTVNVNDPLVAGTPVIAPPELSESPGGSDPLATDQVNPDPLPPTAVSVCE